ncbi:MAG: hypothetical protein K9J17_05985 [Flavobacteriales bacterium]|nr:hypothetical protein [Flavobacteriales bacterium]
MTQDQFYHWLENPALMNADSIAQLREVISRYPYFQAAQMMLAKNLQIENHIDQLNQLQLAAVMASDRKLLHDYLHDRKKTKPKPIEPVEGEIPELVPLEIVRDEQLETVEVEHESLYDLIPEPIIYQLETADLPELVQSNELEEPEQTGPDELSFSEWLAFTESGKSSSKQETKADAKSTRSVPARSNIELIEHFLTQQSDAPRKRAEFFNPQKVASKSMEEDFTVVSETLADIYFQQEKYELASQAYASLSLKYPEKSVYFAARLKEIDDKLNSL